MIKIGKAYRELTPLGSGIYYGYLPKIGDTGLAIRSSAFDGAWKVRFPKSLKSLIPNDCWYQEIDELGEWKWNHGVVRNDGVITQIG